MFQSSCCNVSHNKRRTRELETNHRHKNLGISRRDYQSLITMSLKDQRKVNREQDMYVQNSQNKEG